LTTSPLRVFHRRDPPAQRRPRWVIVSLPPISPLRRRAFRPPAVIFPRNVLHAAGPSPVRHMPGRATLRRLTQCAGADRVGRCFQIVPSGSTIRKLISNRPLLLRGRHSAFFFFAPILLVDPRGEPSQKVPGVANPSSRSESVNAKDLLRQKKRRVTPHPNRNFPVGISLAAAK